MLLVRRRRVFIVKLLVVLPPQGLVLALGAGAGSVGRVGDNVRDLVLGVLLVLQRRVRQTFLVPVNAAEGRSVGNGWKGGLRRGSREGTDLPDHCDFCFFRISSVSSMNPALRAHFGVRALLVLLRMFWT